MECDEIVVTKKSRERFLSRLQEVDGHLLYMYGMHKDRGITKQRPNFCVGGVAVVVQRFAYKIWTGKDLSSDVCIKMRCGDPRCVSEDCMMLLSRSECASIVARDKRDNFLI